MKGEKGMIDKNLLSVVACPQNHMRLREAESRLLERMNRAILAGGVKNAAGRPVRDALQGGLVRQDDALLYPIVDDIPVLLPEEGIPLGQFEAMK